MSKSKYEKIPLENLQSLINNAKTFQEVLISLGYKQTTNDLIISNLQEYCLKNNISFQHLKIFNDTKICEQCKQEKSINDFYPRRKICKKCVQENERKKYYNKQEFLNSYKAQHKCAKCNNDKYYLIDFHHIDPSTKKYNISNNPNIKIETLQEELKKCICLCANCHREFHFLNRENGITLEDYLNNS